MALKGLTAQDRADWEKQYASQLEGKSSEWADNAYLRYNFKRKYRDRYNYDSLSKLSLADMETYWNDDYDKNVRDTLSHSIQPIDTTGDFAAISDATRVTEAAPYDLLPTNKDQEYFREHSEAYEAALGRYQRQQYREWQNGGNPIEDIKRVASEVSPYYRKYRFDDDYITFTPDDWKRIAVEFKATQDIDGDEAAIQYLQKTIQDECSSNQSQAEKLWNGFRGMGANAVASTINLAIGLPKGIYDYVSGNHEDIEGASGFTNFIDAIVDNDVTRWTNDVVQYGTLSSERMARAKESGISEIPIIKTYDEEQNNTGILNLMFNRNTVADLINQYGFTMASLAEGWAYGALSKWGFKALKGYTVARNMKRTGQSIIQMRNTLQNIQRAENAVNRFVIPGMVGTGEGMMNALQTKQDFLERGKQQIAEMQNQYVDSRFKELVAEKYDTMYMEAIKPQTWVQDNNGDGYPTGHMEGYGMTPEQAHEAVLQALYKKAWDEYDEKYQASVDQLEYDAARAGRTNFILNSIINGGLNKTFQATLFNSSIQGQLRSTKLGRVFSSQPNLKVSAGGKVTAELPWYKRAWNYVSESIGESIEEGTQYLSDKYSQGKAENNLANFMKHKYAGDNTAIGEIFADDYMAGLAAAGEALSDKQLYVNMWYGLASSGIGGLHVSGRARRADGSKGGIFKRGINAAGEQESTLEMIARIIPWRSGFAQGYQINQASMKQATEDAEILQTWINNPENKAKFDGLVGTMNWAQDMQRSADSNDAFGYRNSAMGKSINDALVLQKLQGTEYYNALMNQIIEVANLESGSELTQQYVQKVCNAQSTNDTFVNMSDDEIVEQLKKNANQMLETMDKVQQYGDKIENTLGNVDIDTKEALIYGEMMIEDWNKRAEQLREGFKGIEIDNTVDYSTISGEAKAFIAQYGSIEKAFAARDGVAKTVSELTKDVHNLNKRKYLSDKEKLILQQKRAALARSKATLKSFKPLKDMDLHTQVLNEQEIMSLDPVTRANLLNPKNYNKYSEEQRAVIDHLLTVGTNTDTNFQDKIQDAARIQQATDAYMRDYAAVISDPRAFSMYATNAKREAAKAAYRKRYDSINGIEDYNSFAQEMDKLLVDGNPTEKQTILAQLRREEKAAEERGENTNFGKYLKQRQEIADIVSHAVKGETLSKLSGNDIDMFVHALTYVTERGIDVHDNNAIVAALTEVDEKGNSIFEKYVNAVNENAEDATRTEFTSTEEAIQTLNSVLAEYDKDAAHIAESYTPIEVTSEPEAASAPAAAPGIFSQAATSIDDVNKDLKEHGEGTVTPGTVVTEIGQTVEATPKISTELSEAVIGFDTSAHEVLNAARNMEYLINNSKMTAEQKSAALAILQALGVENSYETVEAFANAFKAALNEQDIAYINTDITQHLRSYIDRVVAKAMQDRAQEERQKELEARRIGDTLSKSKLLQGTLGFMQQDVRNSNNVQTLSIKYLKDNFSTDPASNNYSPLLNYLENNGVESFLQSHDLGRDVPVYFVFDPLLAQEQKQVYEEVSKREGKEILYSRDNYPLIAVIEHPQGTITIGDKKYQPIGIMPRTGAKNQYGSNRLDRVRGTLNDTADSPYLISDSKGVIETRLSNHIYAKPMEQVYSNITSFNASINDMTSDERREFEALPIEQRKSSPLYHRIKKQFLDRLVVKRSANTASLYEQVPNLYGKGETTDIQVFIGELADTQGIGMTSTVGEMLLSGNIDVMTANSRFSRWYKALEKGIQSFDDSDVMVMPDGTIGEDSQAIINKFADRLDKSLRNFIFAPQYSSQVSVDGVVDGKIQYILSMTDGTDTITLGAFQAGGIIKEECFDMLRNFITAGNEIRRNNAGKGLVKWQVNYKDIESSDTVAKDNIAHIYDDGILTVSKSALNYGIEGVTVEAPYTMEGVRRTFVSQTANPSNASTPKSPIADQAVEVDGATVDAETGVVLSGTPKVENKALEEAKRIANSIEQDEYHYESTSSIFDRSHLVIFGKHYNNVNTEHVNTPEGAITSIVRGIFNDVLFSKRVLNHPNMTDRAFNNFVANVNAWKNGLIASGITLLSHQTLAILDDANHYYAQEVILGYDANGQWHAYTSTNGDAKLSNEQLAMMCSSIENMYGIKIQDYTSVVLRAEMPRGNNVQVGEGLQVITNNSHVYDGARPSIVSTVTTPYSEITSYADALKALETRMGDEHTESTAEHVVSEEEGSFIDGFFAGIDPIDMSVPSSYISPSQQWGVFDGRGLNVQATVQALEAQGITAESWEKMTEAEREHELECKGVY